MTTFSFKVLDSVLRLLPGAAAGLVAAVNTALLELEQCEPGTLEDTTQATTVDQALAAVGWEVVWDTSGQARLVTPAWLHISRAGLLAWEAAVRPFLAPKAVCCWRSATGPAPCSAIAALPIDRSWTPS
jgi:hypothetical protein